MTLTKGTTGMKTVVKYQKNNACALLMNPVNAAVIALHGVIMFTMTLIVTKGEI